jgi:hypothetical protein
MTLSVCLRTGRDWHAGIGVRAQRYSLRIVTFSMYTDCVGC